MINVEINSKLTKNLQYKYKMIFARYDHKKNARGFLMAFYFEIKNVSADLKFRKQTGVQGGIFIATALPLQAIPASPFPVFSNAQSLAPRF
jgi:hypothetical protein